MARAALDVSGVPVADHAAPDALTVRPVRGLPEFRPGDDLAAALADGGPLAGRRRRRRRDLQGRLEGRGPAGARPRRAGRARRAPPRAGRRARPCGCSPAAGRTLIVTNPLGIVQAAAGIDASNVRRDELALLPVDPDAARRARCAPRCAERLGVDVAVVVTDTLGRTWRDRADRRRHRLGRARGAAPLRGHGRRRGQRPAGHRGRRRRRARRGRRPGQGQARRRAGRGRARAAPRSDDGSGARDLVRPLDEDLFWLGTDEALARGRREAVLLRRSTREFADDPVDPEALRRAVGVALTAPAPHHSSPFRFGGCAIPRRRAAVLDAHGRGVARGPGGDGRPPDEVARRMRRGDLLRGAPELVLAVPRPATARTPTPTGAAARPSRRCSPSPVAPRCSRCSWRWPPRGWRRAGSGPRSSRRTSCARCSTCRRTGSRSARWRSACRASRSRRGRRRRPGRGTAVEW